MTNPPRGKTEQLAALINASRTPRGNDIWAIDSSTHDPRRVPMPDLMQRPDIITAPTTAVPAGDLTAEHIGQHITAAYCEFCNEHLPATEATRAEHAHPDAETDAAEPRLEPARLQLAAVAHERYTTTLTVTVTHLGPVPFIFDHDDSVTITRPVPLPIIH